MHEMKEVWREMQAKGGSREDAPLRASKGKKKPPSSYRSAAGEAGQEEPDLLDTGFTLRELGPGAVRAWLALQVVALAFQLLLWREVSGHLAEFEAAVARECAEEHRQRGVCVGPMWNVSARADLVIPGKSWFASDMDVVYTGAGWSNSRTLDFSTSSSPPTFLLFIDPVSRSQAPETPPEAPRGLSNEDSVLQDLRWTLEVQRTRPRQASPLFRRSHVGTQAVTVEDLSEEAQQEVAKRGHVEWRATLTSLAPSDWSTRYVAYVEDAATQHLAEIHGSPHCAFGRSWKAFNQQHQGRSHRALAWCRFLLGVFLLLGGAAMYCVLEEAGGGLRQGAGGQRRFHAVVAAKFLLQDVPQQLCIVLYLFGWYENTGLRCQLCLFHPRHCGEEDAFHLTNLVALSCTLLSSVANQLLVRPVTKKRYTEDDVCVQGFLRAGGLCVAILPFTTGMFWASGSILAMPRLFHLLVSVPCAFGWFSIVVFGCFGFVSFCLED